MKKWKCKKSEIVYDSKYFRVKKDSVELPGGEIKEWTYWDSNDSAMVIGRTEKNKLVMIRQYRYLVNDEVIEFPSGAIKNGEKPEEAAKREFEEESGYICEQLIKLCSVYETYGQLNRKIHIFFASKLIKTKQKLDQDEEYEDIKVKLVDFEKALELARENKIVAMGSSLAILMLKEKIEEGKIIFN